MMHRRLTSTALLTLILLGPAPLFAADAPADQPSDPGPQPVAHGGDSTSTPASQLAQLRAKNTQLKQHIAELQARIKRLQQQLQAATDQTQQLQHNARTLRSRNKRLSELAGVPAKADDTAAADARITTRYDAHADRTTVRTKPQRIKVTSGSSADHYLGLAFAYQGASLSKLGQKPRRVSLYLQALRSGDIYRGVDTLTLTADGKPIELAVDHYADQHRSVRIGGRLRRDLDDQTLTLHLTLGQLARVGDAVTVTGRIGRVSFKLTPRQIALFKAMRARALHPRDRAASHKASH